MKSKPTVIDLFCGCGGLSYGFIEAGYDVLLGIDHWKDAVVTFENTHQNAKGIISDLFTETPKVIAQKTGIKNVDVIIGGPPCQGFSIAGKRIIDDERNQLYKSFVGFVKHYQPKVFLMENVPNIVSMGKGVVKDSVIEDFEKLGYTVVYKVLLASDLGVPQNRRRAFFVGTKNRKEFVFENIQIAQKGYIYFSQNGDWESKITITEEFFHNCLKHSAPVDMRIVSELQSPFAIDIYCWLSYRLNSVTTPIRISWTQLQGQFCDATAMQNPYSATAMFAQKCDVDQRATLRYFKREFIKNFELINSIFLGKIIHEINQDYFEIRKSGRLSF